MAGASGESNEAMKALGLDGEQLLANRAVTVLRGTVDEMCDELQRRREDLGLSYIIVSEPMMEPFAPVVEALSGR